MLVDTDHSHLVPSLADSNQMDNQSGSHFLGGRNGQEYMHIILVWVCLVHLGNNSQYHTGQWAQLIQKLGSNTQQNILDSRQCFLHEFDLKEL